MFSSRQRRILARLWSSGPTSRLELARLLELTPNAAGDLVSGLVRQGVPAAKVLEAAAATGADAGVTLRGRPGCRLGDKESAATSALHRLESRNATRRIPGAPMLKASVWIPCTNLPIE